MLGDDVSHPESLAIRRDLEPNANPSVLAPNNAAMPYYLLNDEVEFGRDADAGRTSTAAPASDKFRTATAECSAFEFDHRAFEHR
jgi:hypothetical protein